MINQSPISESVTAKSAQRSAQSGQETAQNNDDRSAKAKDFAEHKSIFGQLLGQIERINFREEVALASNTEKLGKKHYVITCIDHVISLAEKNKWGLCKNNESIYLFNGAYWSQVESTELHDFLGAVALKMGVDKYDARHFQFRDQLLKQFMAIANLSSTTRANDRVKINLKNGTFEIDGLRQHLREPRKEDFLTYQLPFEYNPNSSALAFQEFLDKVLPNKECQMVLAEFIGYLFVRTATLKLEKVLLLYGSGANGKSVFFEIINALLGRENVSHYSLNHLTDDKGQYRAKIGNKLLNYASEINGKMQTDIFKQLASGEPVDARVLYGDPFILTDYARLIFNCNELPRDIEHGPAFFRRFTIIPFSVTIPESEQDKDLANKIIATELPGVFNWVLEGLSRLIAQKAFTNCQLINDQLLQYKKQSDSVQLFIEEEGYAVDFINTLPLKELFSHYRNYCSENGYRACSTKTFSERLKANGFTMERKRFGMTVFIKKNDVF